MNISYNWLRELIDLGISPSETAKALTSVGLAVEGIAEVGGDSILDIDLTSNRPDCLSHRGVARELSAITDTALRTTSRDLDRIERSTELVTIEDPVGCRRFTARIITGVKVGPSPSWLVDRLEAIGERSINNVADITNYVMHELGQPMHAFDLDRIQDGRIVVRRAKAGETIRTLDGVDRELDSSVLMICDTRKPIAVAGIMGGEDSSISELTQNVLVEVAYFERSSIRKASRRLGLATEASYRFERGVDVEALIDASDRAVQLIMELAGGIAKEVVDVYPTRSEPINLQVADLSASLKRLTGQSADNAECNRLLDRLGVTAKPLDKGYSYTMPSWRHDLRIEEDLVEEVARHLGYSTIIEELSGGNQSGEYQATELKERRVRSVLREAGFDEAITYSFIDQRHDELFEIVPGVLEDTVAAEMEKFITLRDSVIEGAVRMRPTLLPGLLDAVRFNMNHQQRDLRLFEIGRVFGTANTEDGLPSEQRSIAIAMTGADLRADRLSKDRFFDFFDIKGSVEMICTSLGMDVSVATAEVRHLRKGQAAEVRVRGEAVGFFGRLADRISAAYKFRQPVFLAELNLGVLLNEIEAPIVYEPISRYPSMVRDVTLPIPKGVTFGGVKAAIREQDAELLRDVGFVDLYEGKDSDDQYRSLTIRLTYRSDDRTLLESDVDELHAALLERVCRKLDIDVPQQPNAES